MRKVLMVIAFLFFTLSIAACTGAQNIVISFDTDGGNVIENMTISMTSTTVELPTPTKEGFTFAGWYTDPGLATPWSLAALLSGSGTLTLYAKWIEDTESYTITFESNGGSTVGPITLAVGATVSAPTNPTKEGFTFGGWYSDVALTTVYTFATMPAQNFTLYAKWNAVVTQQTISFEENGGTEVANITQNVGSAVSAPTPPTKSGYTFGGWYSDTGLITAYTFSVMPLTALTLYAKWTINNYTITFEENGGSAVIDITQGYLTTVTAPANPTKEGYTFGGWYSDIGLTTTYTFTTIPLNGMTLYAKWAINNYTILFEENGGTVVTDISAPYLSSVTAPANPTKEGYTFGGWYSDIGLTTTYTFTTMPLNGITLYAKWTVINYTITFEENGGSAVLDITQGYLTAVTAPTNPTKEGYTFGGWYSDTGLTTAYTFTTMPLNGITLYAKWTLNNYKITFEENGGSAVLDITQGYLAAVTEPANPTKEGYTFGGWYSDIGLTTAYTFITMPLNGLTLYAKWTVINYTVTFEENGGSAVLDITQGYLTTVTAPANPTKEGYTFGGWYSDIGLTTAYTFTTMPLNGITLYAKWNMLPHTISFVYGENTIQPIEFIPGALIVLPADPIRAGYDFVGWFEDALFLVPFDDTTMPDRDVVLYGKWVTTTYTLSFDTNEGSLIESRELNYNQYIGDLGQPTKEGFIFMGWFMDETLLVKINIELMPAKDVVLYAKWMAFEGYNTIAQILYEQPTTTVKVRGVIYYAFPNPMNPGFYLYDGTGYIFVLASRGTFAVGDGVEFNATFNFFEMTPQLVSVTNMVANPYFTTLPSSEEMTFKYLAETYEGQIDIYGRPIIIRGIVGQSGPYFFIADIESEKIIMINYKSYTPMDNPFATMVGQFVSFHAIVHDFNTMGNQWHIIYRPVSPVQLITLNDEDKVDELLAFGSTMLDHMVFYSGQMLKVPESIPVLNATLSVATYGPNASYYDVSLGLFGTTDVMREIGLTLTVTIGVVTKSVNVTIILMPVEMLTIDEFLNVQDDNYHEVTGVVMFIFDEIGLMVIGDQTGMLGVVYQSPDDGGIVVILSMPARPTAQVGDLVIVGGYRMNQEGIILMGNDPTQSLREVIAHDQPNPVEPYVITVAQFAALDVEESLYWLKYFEVSGTLIEDDEYRNLYISDGTNQILIRALDKETHMILQMFTGFEVTLRGLSLPDFDADEPELMLVFGGSSQDIDLNYTDEDLAELIGVLLSEWLESENYYPGQILELETSNPWFKVTVSYETFGENAALLNMTTQQISEDIDVETFIGLRATIRSGTAVEVVEIQLRVVPMEVLTVSEFLALPMDETLHYVKGVVIHASMMEGVVLIADATGILFVVTDSMDLMVGDLVLVQGALMEAEGFIFLANDPSQTVKSIISHDNEMPLVPTAMTIEAFTILDYTDPEYMLQYYVFEGQLLENEEYHIFFLSDGMNFIPVFTPSEEDYHVLMMYKGQEVSLAGLSLYNQSSEEPMMMLIFINFPGDIEFSMTDAELSIFLANALQSHYGEVFFIPGSTHELPLSYAMYENIVTYVLFGDHASLYNLETGYISEDILVETWIDVRATIDINGSIQVVEFTLHVIPVELVTVAEFLAGSNDVPYKLEVVVILAMTNEMDAVHVLADETGYLFCAKPFDFVLGDLVVLIGTRTLHEGVILLWDDTEWMDTISSGNPSPLAPVSHSIDSFNLIPIEDPTTWGMYVELTGYVGRAQDIGYLLTENLGGGDFVGIISMGYAEMMVLEDYFNLQVTIKGFMMPYFDGEESEPDRVFAFAVYDESIGLVSSTDQEKMDELIALGSYHLEGKIYHPYDYLELRSEFPALGATLIWSITSDNAELYDVFSQRLNNVTEIEIITFEATATIGTLTVTHAFDVEVHPYPVTTIADYRLVEDYDMVKLQGIIIEEVSSIGYILQDSTGMTVIYGYHDVQVGWEIEVFGQKDSYNNVAFLSGYFYNSQYNVLNMDVVFTVPYTPMTLQDIGLQDSDMIHPMVYTSIRGRIVYSWPDEYYYITDGVYIIYIYGANVGATNDLDLYEGSDVTIKVYLNDYSSHFLGERWSVIFMGDLGDIQAITFTDAEILEMMYNYVFFDIDHVYVENKISMYSTNHPIYDGTISLSLIGPNAVYGYIFENQFAITDIPEELYMDLEVTIRKGTEEMTFTFSVLVLTNDEIPADPFIPGSKGVMPSEPEEAAEGTFGGFMIDEIERHNEFMGSGTEMVVNMSFPDAASLGANYLTLQYYNAELSEWFDYLHGGVPLTTTGDNFSLVFNGPATLRLMTSGLPTGNLSSNVIQVQFNNIDTYFAGWSLDESMYLTGVMFPYVGHGLYIDDVVVYTTANVEVIGGISYQWYRLNPNTFETILIVGETDQLYITTMEDVGYYIMVKVIGNGITVGGYMQILSMSTVQLLNKAIVTDLNGSGFTLSFEYDVTMADLAYLKIYNQEYAEITPVNITPTADPSVYQISLDMLGATELHLEIQTPVWVLGHDMFGHPIPGFMIQLT